MMAMGCLLTNAFFQNFNRIPSVSKRSFPCLKSDINEHFVMLDLGDSELHKAEEKVHLVFDNICVVFLFLKILTITVALNLEQSRAIAY